MNPIKLGLAYWYGLKQDTVMLIKTPSSEMGDWKHTEGRRRDPGSLFIRAFEATEKGKEEHDSKSFLRKETNGVGIQKDRIVIVVLGCGEGGGAEHTGDREIFLGS